jgi:hypothetical protein
MSRINILKASVKDFALEVVTNLPSGTSHEDGRIVKRLDGSAVKLYMWHAATTEWIEFGNFDDLSSLETRLSVEESSENAAVASMEVIDSSLETRISTEEVARAADFQQTSQQRFQQEHQQLLQKKQEHLQQKQLSQVTFHQNLLQELQQFFQKRQEQTQQKVHFRLVFQQKKLLEQQRTLHLQLVSQQKSQ